MSKRSYYHNEYGMSMHNIDKLIKRPKLLEIYENVQQNNKLKEYILQQNIYSLKYFTNITSEMGIIFIKMSDINVLNDVKDLINSLKCIETPTKEFYNELINKYNNYYCELIVDDVEKNIQKNMYFDLIKICKDNNMNITNLNYLIEKSKNKLYLNLIEKFDEKKMHILFNFLNNIGEPSEDICLEIINKSQQEYIGEENNNENDIIKIFKLIKNPSDTICLMAIKKFTSSNCMHKHKNTIFDLIKLICNPTDDMYFEAIFKCNDDYDDKKKYTLLNSIKKITIEMYNIIMNNQLFTHYENLLQKIENQDNELYMYTLTVLNLNNSCEFLNLIKNPTEEMVLTVISKCESSDVIYIFSLIKNKLKEDVNLKEDTYLKLLHKCENPLKLIKLIENPTENMYIKTINLCIERRTCVNKDAFFEFISLIKNPSDKIYLNGIYICVEYFSSNDFIEFISLIKNPSDEIYLNAICECVRHHTERIFDLFMLIKNPKNEMYYEMIKNYDGEDDYWDHCKYENIKQIINVLKLKENPTNEFYSNAINICKNDDLLIQIIKIIKNPSENMLIDAIYNTTHSKFLIQLLKYIKNPSEKIFNLCIKHCNKKTRYIIFENFGK